jgi:hypothetical protein
MIVQGYGPAETTRRDVAIAANLRELGYGG